MVSQASVGTGAQTGRTQVLRVAALWGTTVLALRSLERGDDFVVGDGKGAVLPAPEGIALPPVVVRALQGGWELDARGVLGGVLRLRGRDEDPIALGNGGAPVPIVPGDFGLLQYGLFSIFFQYTSPAPTLAPAWGPELLVILAVVSSSIFHVGVLGMVRALMTPPPLAKPAELTSAEEYAARFNLHRPLIEEAPSKDAEGPEAAGPKEVAKDPKAATASGPHTPSEGRGLPRGARDRAADERGHGSLSDVLAAETGQEIRNTLKGIGSVSDVLGGLSAQTMMAGGGTGGGLRGGPGSTGGGGGRGGDAPFGAGTLQTGGGAGGASTGAPRGATSAVAEARVGVAPGTPTTRGSLSVEQIRRVVMAHAGALRACYEAEAQRNPGLHGGVTATWTIEASGAVSNASVASSTLGNPRVEGCVVRQIKTWRFPSGDAATQVASYPFKFGIGG